MPDAAAHPLLPLLDLPGVAEEARRAREACSALRWHEALRRRIPEAAAESRVRGAAASSALEGAELPLPWVRDAMRGAKTWSQNPDPVTAVMQAAARVTAETERVEGWVGGASGQALARLHVAVGPHLVAADALGRPRREGELVGELEDLGEPVPAAEVPARLAGVGELMRAPANVPAVLVAAVVHAEVASIRPFAGGNGLVARAMERAIVRSRGLDLTGVAVPELGHRSGGGVEYLGALAAYATGKPEGVAVWLRHACSAMVTAAAAGEQVADAVRRGDTGEQGVR